MAINRPFSGRLAKATERHNSLVCCGLDPDITRIPSEFSGPPQQRIGTFLKTVVELTSAEVCAYKIQKAFFDVFDGGNSC